MLLWPTLPKSMKQELFVRLIPGIKRLVFVWQWIYIKLCGFWVLIRELDGQDGELLKFRIQNSEFRILVVLRQQKIFCFKKDCKNCIRKLQKLLLLESQRSWLLRNYFLIPMPKQRSLSDRQEVSSYLRQRNHIFRLPYIRHCR